MSNEENYYEFFNDEKLSDPLEGVHDEIAESFYELNENVFAEPIQHNIDRSDKADKHEEVFRFIDKFIVEERNNKKYRKFHMGVDISSCVCPQQNCGKTFKTNSLLKAHIRKVHCAIRMYVCDICGAGRTAKYLLMRHMDVHYNRRVECPMCKRMLSARTSLSTHLRSHTSARTHECQRCQKRFSRRATLTKHVKLVHRQDSSIAK